MSPGLACFSCVASDERDVALRPGSVQRARRRLGVRQDGVEARECRRLPCVQVALGRRPRRLHHEVLVQVRVDLRQARDVPWVVVHLADSGCRHALELEVAQAEGDEKLAERDVAGELLQRETGQEVEDRIVLEHREKVLRPLAVGLLARLELIDESGDRVPLVALAGLRDLLAPLEALLHRRQRRPCVLRYRRDGGVAPSVRASPPGRQDRGPRGQTDRVAASRSRCLTSEGTAGW